MSNVERLGFGFMRLPTQSDDIDYDKLNPMVDYYIENGGYYFDTGYQYHNGKSEEAIKEAVINRYSRDKVKIADKMPIYAMNKDDDPKKIFNTQLERCGVDYFDYYLVHNTADKFYNGVCKDLDIFSLLKQYKKEGKIKKLGISHHDTAEVLEKILTEHPEIEFVQIQVNYLDWENEGIQSKKCYEVIKKHNLPVIVMEPVKGGTLADLPENAEEIFKNYSDDSSVSWALKYVLNLDETSIVLSGMSSLTQVKDNINTCKKFNKLSTEEENLIQEVTNILHDSIEIDCTYCDYCKDHCPKNIPISKYFSLYNNAKQSTKKQLLHALYYNNYAQEFEKASACIECGLCQKVCPQNIEIIDNLKKVSQLLEDKV